MLRLFLVLILGLMLTLPAPRATGHGSWENGPLADQAQQEPSWEQSLDPQASIPPRGTPRPTPTPLPPQHERFWKTAPSHEAVLAPGETRFEWTRHYREGGVSLSQHYYLSIDAINIVDGREVRTLFALVDAGENATSVDLRLPAIAQTYAWQVYAGLDGVHADRSQEFTFRVDGPPSSTVFSKITPPDGSTVPSQEVEFSWTPLSSATTTYYLSIFDPADPVVPNRRIVQTPVDGTAIKINLSDRTKFVPGRTYTWEVYAEGRYADGQVSSFRIQPAPSAIEDEHAFFTHGDGTEAQSQPDGQWGESFSDPDFTREAPSGETDESHWDW